MAGVIVDILAQGQISRPVTPDKVRDFLFLEASWQRPRGQYVNWNMVDEIHNPPVSNTGHVSILSNFNTSFVEATAS